jgi:peptide/nickel transport system permease protein
MRRITNLVFAKLSKKGGLGSSLTRSCLIIVSIIFASKVIVWLSPYDPKRTLDASQLLPPSSSHFFGTDSNGMDIFTRIFAAVQNDIVLPIVGVVIAMIIGTMIGVFSGYRSGFIDTTITRFSEGIQAVPLFLLGLTLVAALGSGSFILISLITLVNLPIFFRLTRSITMPLRRSDFVLVAKGSGLSQFRIVTKHIIPNVMIPVVAQFPISCGYGIQIIAGLSFLGIGIPIPSAEWGLMIKDGASLIAYGNWWVSFFPGLAILLTVLFFEFLGKNLSNNYQKWVSGL